MPKPSNREKILTEGLKVVHQRGFAGASVRDIVQAAGVPQGSFTNHFTSKEAFGLEIIDLYAFAGSRTAAETLRNEALPPLQRLEAYIDRNIQRQTDSGMTMGCMLGNFAAETCDANEPIRQRLAEIFESMTAAMTECLDAAVASGDLPAGFETATVAEAIVAGLQGAILLGKARRSTAPIESFKKTLFEKILR